MGWTLSFCSQKLKTNNNSSFDFFFFEFSQKSRIEFDLRNQYKSLDDVSLNSTNSHKWNTNMSRSVASAMSKVHQAEKSNCDDRKWNASKFQRCDKATATTTTTRATNWLIMKKDLQCDKCGTIKAVCGDGNIADNRYARDNTCHLSDEHVSSHSFDNSSFKSTNCKVKSESSYSLGRSSSFGSTTDLHLTIRRRIVYAQVLLEAFGNATIPLNSNSSRFVSRFNKKKIVKYSSA